MPLSQLRALFRYRQLVRNLVVQRLKIRYRHSALGFFWSILNPVLMIATLSFIFSHLMGRHGVHSYPIFLFCGMLPYSMISGSVLQGGQALIRAEGFLKNVRVAPVVFPTSVVGDLGVNFTLSMGALMLAVGPIVGLQPSVAMCVLPASMLVLLLMGSGLALLAALSTLYFRDLEHIFEVVMRALYFFTPILYPLYPQPGEHGLIQENHRIYFEFNPFYHLVELFRQPIYHGEFPEARHWYVTVGFGLFTVVAGSVLLRWRRNDLIFRL